VVALPSKRGEEPLPCIFRDPRFPIAADDDSAPSQALNWRERRHRLPGAPEEHHVSKAYWCSIYRKVHDPQRLADYARMATPAILDGGGRFLIRGTAAFAHGAGLKERTVVIEFESLEKAMAAFHGKAYQAALEVLGDSVERDFRIVEGTD
jgi:uncharacterized protein (DUF1330 family)